MSSNQSDGAVVTGAASGIGRAIAAGLAADGFSVVVADLDEFRLHATYGMSETMITAITDQRITWLSIFRLPATSNYQETITPASRIAEVSEMRNLTMLPPDKYKQWKTMVVYVTPLFAHW
jgi:hypothetical protein